MGVLPLTEQTIIPWTRTLVSLPFCTYGGPLADDEVTQVQLVTAAERLANERGIARVSLRCERALPLIQWSENRDKVSMVLDLPPSTQELSKRLGSKLRAQIKRAEIAMPEVSIGSVDLLDDFFLVFRHVMRDLGTPVYPRAFFDIVAKALRDNLSVIVIRINKRPVSAAILVRHRDIMEVPWAATLRSVNPLSVNMRLYWELLRHSIDSRCASFDFGRCTVGSGTYRFKSQWGAMPKQLYWYSRLFGSKSDFAESRRPGGDMSALVNVWKRLPVPIASWIGARISARLPW